jgi:hypothetical protein
MNGLAEAEVSADLCLMPPKVYLAVCLFQPNALLFKKLT